MPTIEKNWGHFRLKPDLWKRLKEIAKSEDRTLTAVMNRALEQYLQKKARDEKATSRAIQQ